MSFLGDFKTFALKLIVLDPTVGVVAGGAFGKMVAALVGDVGVPIVGLALPSGSWHEAKHVLRTKPEPKPVVGIQYGTFLGSVVDFVVIALARQGQANRGTRSRGTPSVGRRRVVASSVRRHAMLAAGTLAAPRPIERSGAPRRDGRSGPRRIARLAWARSEPSGAM